MRKIMIAMLLFVSFGSFAAPEHDNKDLKELLNIMDMSSMVNAMYSQMEVMFQGMARDMGVSGEEQPIFDRYFSKMTAVMREEMSWEKMEPEVVRIYSTTFTEKEISDMLAFYKTESGQSVLKKLPIVMQQSMQFSQASVRAVMPKIQKISEELQKELQNHRAGE